MISRLLCSPTFQRFYAPIRRAPVVGTLAHGLMARLLPRDARVPVRVRAGAAAGLLLSLDPRYEVPYAAGDYEELLLRKLRSCLRRGDVLYDVGAHAGFVSMVAARFVGATGKVYAFEADADNSKRILEHVEMNALRQVELVAAAVWSECTRVTFRKAPDSSSRNTGAVSGKADEGVADASIVEAVTLDYFAREHRPPTAIKIDVEGAEEEVLAGAGGVLRGLRPRLICEVHNGGAAEGVSRQLAAYGYRWEWLDETDRFPRHLVAEAQG